ncbi:Tigger transposable element-derived protein 4 [Araneus ventricosus]|uniref:Tigger transposable element-derived protein 4 n=1 Tax=Araneus ventricosus TaxID=182803 RepID=A0A4Y2X473_ARAVE|nr:Tigger transposable element-derived protein 4 [Araneus ventricosus]
MKPHRSFVFKDETASGGKQAKQRLTVLLCSYMSSTEKLPLLAIGKSKKPRSFKGIKTLPDNYKNNSKLWMTSSIFEELLRCLDKQMTIKHRKIVLVIDNCTAHPEIKGLKSITVEFFQPNVTYILQPLDQGVIMSFKCNYRKLRSRRIVSALDEGEDNKVDILTALHLSKAAWNDVTENTIKNCFRHAGFKKTTRNEIYC